MKKSPEAAREKERVRLHKQIKVISAQINALQTDQMKLLTQLERLSLGPPIPGTYIFEDHDRVSIRTRPHKGLEGTLDGMASATRKEGGRTMWRIKLEPAKTDGTTHVTKMEKGLSLIWEPNPAPPTTGSMPCDAPSSGI